MPSPSPRRRRRNGFFAGGLQLLFQKLALLTVLHSLLQLAAAHQTTSRYPQEVLGEWKPGRATYYSASDPRDTISGACGYGDLGRSGYGLGTLGLSEVLFEKGQICGACFEVRCVEELRYCIPGTSIKLTVTNFCPPTTASQPTPAGTATLPTTTWIRCGRQGGMRFTVDGYGVFHSVLISNVAGAGDVTEVKVKGSRTGWLQMARNWGQNWHINADLRGQPLSFERSPSDWSFGQTYVGKQFVA
ncbi:unnamed protein product [Spirodela intermedia]|uniref:Expansin n=1 Tax=Spirodela intermedia TaxID=51605 RepID=A0A7I8IDG9_SPIIN|nr:unnamed protein product [Spirodela intermedia]CAA6655820.1 unnamed protein product [Spirodela intermedia]